MPLPCTGSKVAWIFLLYSALCIERRINGISFTRGLQELFSPCLQDRNYNSKRWGLLLSSWLLSERGETMHRFKNHFSLMGSVTGRLQPCTCMQSSTNCGNLELLGCHTSCSLPPPKELTIEKHQEVVSLGTAKWKSVISPYRQYNENVETNLCGRREMNERLVCRTKSSVGNIKYFRLVFWLTLAAWSIRSTHVLV